MKKQDLYKLSRGERKTWRNLSYDTARVLAQDIFNRTGIIVSITRQVESK
jgi:hypothetical protein